MTGLSPFQHWRFARMCEQLSAESERRGTASHRGRVDRSGDRGRRGRGRA
jgi:hypothetical protein